MWFSWSQDLTKHNFNMYKALKHRMRTYWATLKLWKKNSNQDAFIDQAWRFYACVQDMIQTRVVIKFQKLELFMHVLNIRLLFRGKILIESYTDLFRFTICRPCLAPVNPNPFSTQKSLSISMTSQMIPSLGRT